MFAETIELFDQYCHSFESTPGELHRHLSAEVKERLKQLDLIIRRARELEVKDQEIHQCMRTAMGQHGVTMITGNMLTEGKVGLDLANAVGDALKKAIDNSIEVRLFTEAFYYFAARVRSILRHESRPLPFLQSFECRGVRDVRNHLIEHPESAASQVFAQSIGYGGEHGPTLKTGRPAGERMAFPDKGLYLNAAEFKQNLEALLRSAIARA